MPLSTLLRIAEVKVVIITPFLKPWRLCFLSHYFYIVMCCNNAVFHAVVIKNAKVTSLEQNWRLCLFVNQHSLIACSA